jgi:hypothetical protein
LARVDNFAEVAAAEAWAITKVGVSTGAKVAVGEEVEFIAQVEVYIMHLV